MTTIPDKLRAGGDFALADTTQIERPGGGRAEDALVALHAGIEDAGTAVAAVDARVSAVATRVSGIDTAVAAIDTTLARFRVTVDEDRILVIVDGSDDQIELGAIAADGTFHPAKWPAAITGLILRAGGDVDDGSGDLLQILDATVDGVYLLRITADGTVLGKGLGAAATIAQQAAADAATALARANAALASAQGSSRRQLMRELAVRSALANPVSLPAMASPPTITCAAGGAPAALPVSISVGRAGAVAVMGGDVLGSGSDFQQVCSVTIPGNGNVGAGKSALAWAVECWSDAPLLAFLLACDPTTCFFRLQVDGVYVSKLFTQANAAGGATSITLDFAGVRRPRLIRLEMGGNSAIRDIAVTKYDSVWAPRTGDIIRACYVGDSLIEGLAGKHSPAPGATWAPVTSMLLGWRNSRLAAIGGTGYLNPGPADGVHWKWGDHAADWLNWAPDVLLFGGTVNDTGFAAADVAVEARRLWTQARAALPAVPIIVFGLAVDPAFVGNAAAIENALADAYAAWGDANGGFIRLATDPAGPWIVGGGGDGVDVPQTGAGNADLYEGGPPHPNQAGDEYLAFRLATAIRDIVARF